MTNKKLTTIIITLILFIGLSGIAGAGDWKTADSGGFHLEWMVDGENLNVKVSTQTEGWVAVGFNPSRKMKDANIIIGFVENGTVTIEDHFGNGQISHRSDTSLGGNDDVSNKAGTEVNGVTELSFTIPLDSGEQDDRALMEGETYKVIFASYRKDKITMKHNHRSSVMITL